MFGCKLPSRVDMAWNQINFPNHLLIFLLFVALTGFYYYNVTPEIFSILGLDSVIRLYVKILEEIECLILQDRCRSVHIPFVRMVKFKILHNSQWITFPIQSCLILYSFCVNLLHSIIMGSIVSSLSPHNLYLLFCCFLSILALL